ncbi:sensor histidine kinase [Winogradskyella sediminis]|uniref:histidine kinase n=1 Tax=Winogradskyella sediminis TaxID=1382466 RepID=A0A1H1M619_9FLAO|nr:HAMP domain-containing sensor histidine kinase [Winogradskyella sediminis]REG85950.1 two-component system phosphate regulon sensor histidine kinase PhoR [Winogradskyella sediminis]SDR82228.1 two-component system, OmpR family, phosphate regulon sensor histidine kinase PhoR [Winogradskyella sediminis]
MGKKLFVLLVILMSLSLIGIIFVQLFFINNSLENENKNFTFSVKRSLSLVSKAIEDYEYRDYFMKLQPYLSKDNKADSAIIKQLFIATEDDDAGKTIIHRNTVLEERFKVPSLFFEIDADSFNISKLSSERVTETYNNTSIDGNRRMDPETRLREYSSLTGLEKQVYDDTFKTLLKDKPVYKRVSVAQVENLLRRELKSEGIDLNFEFAIYDDDLATKVKTENFEFLDESAYGVKVFLDNNKESSYNLWIDFPERKKYLFSSILWMIVLSIIFTSIIIIAYTSAIYQLIRQRQISQIKTDFINNMTHEFKTPIATINLALDSIKNPKILNDQEKVLRYLGMIKDENKRMHAQVENVLRISKLDKNELNISKERLDMHDLVEDAVTHVELIVEDRRGYVKTHLNADQTSILANDTHFTNVIVNILDNAIKYSDEAPKIDVYTENVGHNIILKIADQGNGMSKAVAKRVFEKFYREHTGNVHNVKGHGLGLAYVKKIVEDHQGHISVESEKGKGSTFIIKMPLIS